MEFEISGNGRVGESGILLRASMVWCSSVHIHTHAHFSQTPDSASYLLPPHSSIPGTQTYWTSLKGTYLCFHLHEPLYLLSICLFCPFQSCSTPFSSSNFCVFYEQP